MPPCGSWRSCICWWVFCCGPAASHPRFLLIPHAGPPASWFIPLQGLKVALQLLRNGWVVVVAILCIDTLIPQVLCRLIQQWLVMLRLRHVSEVTEFIHAKQREILSFIDIQLRRVLTDIDLNWYISLQWPQLSWMAGWCCSTYLLAKICSLDLEGLILC